MAPLLTLASTSSRAQLPLLSRLILGLALTLVSWQGRRQTRRCLARLEAYRLADIGLTPDFVATEVAKPFWRG